MRRLVSPTGRRKMLPPVRPNLGVTQAYQRRMDCLIDEMGRSVLYHVKAAYRANPPANLAMDKSPAAVLNETMAALVKRWTARFAEVAKSLATRFADQAMGRAQTSLKAGLKKAGLTVEWKLTPAANDAYRALIAENVGLIRSIPAQYLTQVQGHVMRSVARGGDLKTLTEMLQNEFGVTRRRAELIARDQNAKATAVIVKTRQLEAGLTQAIWLHSAGGKVPRPSHVKAGRERLVFKVSEGALIDGERIWPGQLINCRCVSRPILEGMA